MRSSKPVSATEGDMRSWFSRKERGKEEVKKGRKEKNRQEIKKRRKIETRSPGHHLVPPVSVLRVKGL